MNAERQEVRVKRVSSRKRSLDNVKSLLTPAKKRGGGACLQLCSQNLRVSSIMADGQAAGVCCPNMNLNLKNKIKKINRANN